jgi:hypothetical protein
VLIDLSGNKNIEAAEKLPLFFVIIGGWNNFSAAYNQLVTLKSKTYCQKTSLFFYGFCGKPELKSV